ncbi:DMT family transporter [Martelella endophytica]|uniref:Membrane protein n=1 Tax=Martelella endophytica TaxID=1486262 RepID=A0A0D5LPT0_MAREN|nr:DMT family transporter [Martelella endophytica]AJY45777.1 membrane protein [Martelella endophytica]
MKVSGIVFAFSAITIFAIQDAITRHLGPLYSPFFISMVRFWAFGAFVVILAARSPVGFRKAIATQHLGLQIWRSLLLVGQIFVSILSFAMVGLAQSQAIFMSAPLVVALLSVPLLGEKVGWRRWIAIIIGLFGVLIIINPFDANFSMLTLIPVGCCITFSLYSLYTRLAGRYDGAEVSLFYTGIVGLVVTSLIGPFFWETVGWADWGWLAALCITGISGHYCLIRALEVTEAVTVQTVTYLQLVYASLFGVLIFHETLTSHMVIGALIVVGAGVFTIWREHALKQRKGASSTEASLVGG